MEEKGIKEYQPTFLIIGSSSQYYDTSWIDHIWSVFWFDNISIKVISLRSVFWEDFEYLDKTDFVIAKQFGKVPFNNFEGTQYFKTIQEKLFERQKISINMIGLRKPKWSAIQEYLERLFNNFKHADILFEEEAEDGNFYRLYLYKL